MGKSWLTKLISDGAGIAPGAVAALCAELEGVCWDSPSAVVGMYPKAVMSGSSIRIPIDSNHCVDLRIRFSDDMVMVTYAGATSKAPRSRVAKGRRSA